MDGTTVKEGDWITIDGFTGEVILGELETRPPEVLQVLLERQHEAGGVASRTATTPRSWSGPTSTAPCCVRTNADQPDQAANAIAFGAQGIGLCRTEHMFFEGERIMNVREMILADSTEAREQALAKLLPMQRDDFAGLFRAMGDRPVTIRTLDPPLHEFVPHDDDDVARTAKALGVSEETVRAKVADLHENNPMLGHRGCRLGIAYPEITAMQVRAILEAACQVKKEGVDVHPEIMIPLVGIKAGARRPGAPSCATSAREVFAEQGIEVDYLVGTMIEIPRAALTADKIAETAEFFSFGTNDLTQMTFGVSRDDAGKFLPQYLRQEIWPADPFATLDQEGVGQLVEIGIERGRSHARRPQGRHLRRARRRPGDRQVLPPRRDELRELLALPPARRPPRRRPGGHRGPAASSSSRSKRGGARAVAALRRPHRRGAQGRPRASTLRVGAARTTPAAVARLLDDVAAEPGHPLLHLPGSLHGARLRRRFSRAAGDERALDLVAEDRRPRLRHPRDTPGRRGSRARARLRARPHPWPRVMRGQGLGHGARSRPARSGPPRTAFVKATLSVFADNVAAQAFYERRGFVREGLRRAQLRRGGEYHDEVLMARFLTTVS